MDPDLVAQIKAGEVIERPASVVKELIENSLDAGSRRIRVEISDGGRRLIRVVDDGIGIEPSELALAFAEHTSSKLQHAAQLESLETLGFRGEALHAISNVASVEAISGARGATTARRVVFDYGQPAAEEPAAPAGGTRVTVRDLFARVPARRKHLRSGRAESAAVHQMVAQYALVHPGVAISLVNDGRPVLTAPGTGRVEDAFASVYGSDLVDRMLPVKVDGPVEVSGVISAPNVTRANRAAINIAVNGRPVRSPSIVFALIDAYGDLLMVGRYPMAAISIRVPAEEIDPNIHPAKLEVRLLSERAVFSAVRTSVACALASQDAVAEPVEILTEWAETEPLSGRASQFVPEGPRPTYPEQVSFAEPPRASTVPSLGGALPVLRVFGQAGLTFIVAEGPAGLYMIDQHAAHERVLFDELHRRPDGSVSQPLLDPVRLELTPDQWTSLEECGDSIESLGFSVEPFGDRWCTIRALPVVGGKAVRGDILGDVLEALNEARSAQDVTHRVLTVVACKAAVKAGQTLTMEEMRELVSQLERTENPRSCPHGRPTTIHISTERLEREFGRR